MDISRALSPVGGVLVFAALFAVFVGERVLGEGTGRMVADGLAAALFLAGVLWKVRALLMTMDAAARRILLQQLVAASTAAAGVGLYAASLHAEKDAQGVVAIAGYVVLSAGAAVLASLELVAAPMRRASFVEPHRVQTSTVWALGTTLALAGLALANFAAETSDVRKDFSFGAPTAPSSATRSMLEATKCKPEVVLFFERGSTSLPEVRDYFDALAQHGVPVKTIDQAMDPALAKEMKVSKNGTIGLKCGERSEVYFVGDDREAAQRKVSKLDEEVRTRLAKLTRDPKVVYFTVGHGERALDEADKDERPAASKLKKLVEALNAKGKKLGIAEGLGRQIPDDAGAVVVVGPTSAFLPVEAEALARYVEGGGALLVAVDPGVDAGLLSLLDALNVKLGSVEVANDKEFVRQSYTDADKAFLFSTSFGSHKSVKTLNGARGKAALLFMGAGTVEKAEKTGDKAAAAKVTTVARARPQSWIDLDGDRAFDEGVEKRAVYDLAAAVEQTNAAGKEARVLVVGDSDALSDLLVGNEANAIFAYDVAAWLLRDDAAAGEAPVSNEDVPLRHSRDEDALWFYGTIFAAPVLVLAVGLWYVRRKRSRGSR